MTPKPTQSEPLSKLPVILIGAGDHACVLIDVLRLLGRQILYATDYNSQRHGKSISGIEIKGYDNCVYDHTPDEVFLVNAVGSIYKPIVRQRIYEIFNAEGFRFETIIHPSAIIAPSVEISEGAQLMAGVVIQPNVKIGFNALVNTQACIDHDCNIGAHTHVAPGVTLSGGVRIKEAVHIGTGAVVIQGIDIGLGAVIGAGAVVVRDVPVDTLVVGVPAKPMQKKTLGKASADQSTANTLDGTSRRRPQLMLSASGKRVSLLQLFEQSIRELGLDINIIATDVNLTSSAFHLAKYAYTVPRYSQDKCLSETAALCERERIGLIIPTIDPDLDFYTQHHDVFQAAGTAILLCCPETIKISNDKQATHEWLIEQSLPTVKQTDLQSLLESDDSAWVYPLFVKPQFGSSSIGAHTVLNRDELGLLPKDEPYIVQSIATGQEYTVDVYVDRKGRCRCAVPRLRLETRSGEVSKGMTCRIEPVHSLAKQVAEALPGARGVLNIQIFYDHHTNELAVVEINTRFGGGYPLTHKAGAPMTQWVLEEHLGITCSANDDDWRDGVVMLRYDEAVFVSRQDAGLNRFGEPISAQEQSPIRP